MTKRGQFQEHANKTVNLVKGLLIRLMAWGCGGIGNASIATLLKDLRERRIFSDPRLDGVVFTRIYWWPGPIHEGNGIRRMTVDEQATEQQGFMSDNS
jgi:Protein of unknown function (DUF1326)